jgi:hypothetical protein
LSCPPPFRSFSNHCGAAQTRKHPAGHQEISSLRDLGTGSNAYFRPKRTSISSNIPNNDRKVFSIVYHENMPEHFEVREFLQEMWYFEGCDEVVVRVQIGDYLYAAVKGNDLPFDVFLDQPGHTDECPWLHRVVHLRV